MTMTNDLAFSRVAIHLAQKASEHYPHQYERWLEHFMGGRPWDEEWDKASLAKDESRNISLDNPVLDKRERRQGPWSEFLPT